MTHKIAAHGFWSFWSPVVSQDVSFTEGVPLAIYSDDRVGMRVHLFISTLWPILGVRWPDRPGITLVPEPRIAAVPFVPDSAREGVVKT